MPQVWVTYGEIAAHFGMTVDSAKAHVAACGLTSRTFGDGETRIRLPSALALEFFAAEPDFLSAAVTRLETAASPAPPTGEDHPGQVLTDILGGVADWCVGRLNGVSAKARREDEMDTMVEPATPSHFAAAS